MQKVAKLYKKTSNILLDIFYPKFCVGCGIEGTYLCRACKKGILPVQMQVCCGCGRISENGQYCRKCRDETIFLKGIITSAYYEEGPLREIIHNFKYNSVTEFGDILSKLQHQALKNCDIENSLKIENCLPADATHQALQAGKLIITFAPLHLRRLAQRGYNQAEILAQKLSKKTKIPCEELLVKTKNTKAQAKLSGKNRKTNLHNSFKIKNLGRQKFKIKNNVIILVDDIATTGATLNECARALKEAGAKEVWGLVVARG